MSVIGKILLLLVRYLVLVLSSILACNGHELDHDALSCIPTLSRESIPSLLIVRTEVRIYIPETRYDTVLYRYQYLVPRTVGLRVSARSDLKPRRK